MTPWVIRLQRHRHNTQVSQSLVLVHFTTFIMLLAIDDRKQRPTITKFRISKHIPRYSWIDHKATQVFVDLKSYESIILEYYRTILLRHASRIWFIFGHVFQHSRPLQPPLVQSLTYFLGAPGTVACNNILYCIPVVVAQWLRCPPHNWYAIQYIVACHSPRGSEEVCETLDKWRLKWS